MIHPQELLVEATDTGDWFEHRCDGVRPLLDGVLIVHDETGPWSTERPHDDGSGAVGTWEVQSNGYWWLTNRLAPRKYKETP